jgi:hypothetical protein
MLMKSPAPGVLRHLVDVPDGGNPGSDVSAAGGVHPVVGRDPIHPASR